MAISSAICSSFKQELLQGKHSFESSGGHTFKIALFDSDASLGAGTTAYSSSEEITNTSGTAYKAGGKALTSVPPTLASSTAVCDFADVSWTSASFTARGCLIYNTTAVTGFTTNRSVCAINFGANKTVTSGTFTIQFPAQTAGNAIIQIA